MIKGYIIDLDGTLADSMTVWNDLGVQLLLNHGIIPEDNLNTILASLSINQSIDYLISYYKLPVTAIQLHQEIDQLLEIAYASKVNLKKGAVEFINGCYQQNKKLCLLTANKTKIATALLNKYHLLTKFTCIITCDNINLDKNNPHIYIEAAKRLDLHPDECIVIEDAYHAIKSAKINNFIVWAIYDSSNQDQWPAICEVCDCVYNNLEKMEVI